MKNNSFARFACALFIFENFVDVLVLSKTGNDRFCSFADEVSDMTTNIQFFRQQKLLSREKLRNLKLQGISLKQG